MNTTTPQLPDTVHTFDQLLSSTRRGARLARLLTVERLQAWHVPPAHTERIEHVVAELASNAALHGRVQGRDFRIGLALDKTTGILRAALTDARGDRLPWPQPNPDDESGRGLVLVAALADRWGTIPYPPSGKTVWAEFDLRQPAR
ncbi:ATP-binding protein [Streptomyces acidiscabies]|uniref:Regulatory protein n=1 Tax=Streptomyces acidiscabies TaxID=42234 RepID=A0A0L0KF40_9ACTN|nr:ATP-binding protein [Streptomyces acidiscabies]KND36285.1 regulatory protein [Streptomyces acidiscabies]